MNKEIGDMSLLLFFLFDPSLNFLQLNFNVLKHMLNQNNLSGH